MLKLRLIHFFDRTIVNLTQQKYSNADQENVDHIVSNPSATLDIKKVKAWCGSPYAIWLGDNDGHIHWFSNDYKLNSFKAFENKIQFMKYSQEKNLLMCIGDDSPTKGGTKYRIFSITFTSPSKLTIRNVKEVKEGRIFVNKGFSEQELTCFDVDEKFSTFALGTKNEGFVIFKGDIIKHINPSITLKKERNSIILNLHFVNYQGELRIFVCTTNRISSYIIHNSGEIQVVYHDDIYDNQFYLTCLNNQTNCLLIWKQDAVFTYHPHEGNLSAIPCDGEGISLNSYSNYFIAISKESHIHPDTTVVPTHTSKSERQSLHIFLSLPELRLIAFKSLFENIHCLVSGMQNIFVITSNTTENDQVVVHKLHEKSILERIDSLTKKRLFEWASLLAIREKQPSSIVQEIYLQHGDSLFLKQKYDQALSAYTRTIGHTDPSYIIEKYLSAHRIRNLSEYLLELHRTGNSTKEHTIMLFKCYTSLHEKPKIEHFTNLENFKKYDLRSVIMECRKSGYSQLALDLSKSQEQHDLYVTILIEDFMEIGSAMKYMRSISAPISCTLIVKFGRTLIKNQPMESLNLIYDIMDNNNLGIEAFLPLFVNHDELLLEFLSRYVSLSDDDSTHMISSSSSSLAIRSTAILTLIELLLRQWKNRTTVDQNSFEEKAKTSSEHHSITDRYTPLYKDNRTNIKLFQLSQPEMSRLIMKLLKYHLLIDEEFKTALKLCLFYSFEPGIIYCSDKISFFQIPLSLYEKNNNVKALINYCSQSTLVDSILWTQALTYITTLDDPETYLGEILQHIKAGDLLPPLAVLNILSGLSFISCCHVNQYLLECFEEEESILDYTGSRLMTLFQDHNDIKHKLVKNNQPIKSCVSSNCCQCLLPLELPSIHFYCGHSYHIYCIASESICQKCEPLISSRKQMKEQRKFKHENSEEFFKYLKGSKDGLEYISNHFGKDMFADYNLKSHKL